MKNIKLMNKIASVGTDIFDKSEYNVGAEVANEDAIMVRSAALHDIEFAPSLKAIARCGAGVNNIPIDRCTENGIVVFNTPGANANGVKELAICALLMAARDVAGGIAWSETLGDDENAAKTVEASKSAFAGCELVGKTLGVIGLGAIGGLVANAAIALGMKVIGCDPYITIEGAWNLSREIKKAATYDDVYKEADFVTLHVPSTPTTKNMINADAIARMKDGVKIINLARADLVNADDIRAALESGKVTRYVTDFPTPQTIGVKGIVNIPHLGASTTESEDNCAVMAAMQLDTFLKTGNIKNSVNFPNVSMPYGGHTRIVVFHKNIPNMISGITSAVSALNINIENAANGSKGANSCTLLEVFGEVPASLTETIEGIEGVYKALVIA